MISGLHQTSGAEGVLVVLQVSLALVLLVGGGLFIRIRLAHVRATWVLCNAAGIIRKNDGGRDAD